MRGVGCGSAFSVLHQALNGPALDTNWRQRDPQHRQLLDDWRGGDYTTAVEAMAGAGMLHNYRTRDDALQAMIGQWQHRSQGVTDGHQLIDGLLMVTATNESVHDLNQAAQTIRQHQGQVGPPQHYTGLNGAERSGVGDVVVFRQPDRHDREGRHTGPDLVNGVQAVVTATHVDRGVSVEWNGHDQHGNQARQRADIAPSYIADGGLQLGYALTMHRAQGVTVKGDWERPDGSQHKGDVLFDTAGADANMWYVGLSRHHGHVAAFTSLDAVNSTTGDEDRGPVGSQYDLDQRVMEAIVARAEATRDDANDRPVSHELGRLPATMQPAGGRETLEKHAKQIDQRTRQQETGTNQQPAPASQQPHGRRTDMSEPGATDPVSDREQMPEPAPVTQPAPDDRWRQLVEQANASRPAR